MAETKPTKVPRWNEGGSNRTEPPETGSKSKTTGWAVDDAPPSSYFNWLQYYTGAFLKWVNERMFDGSNPRDFTIQSVLGASGEDGGELFLLAEDGNTNANGGIVRINTGDGGATSGSGGAFIVECGDAPTDGWGGGIIMNAGDGIGGYFGGNVSIQSGDAVTGTGGNMTINAGDSVSGPGGTVNINGGDGDNAGGINITGGTGIGAAGGGSIAVTAGDSGATSGGGGDINITAGSSRQSEGGDISVTAGSCIQTAGSGGDISLTGGNGIDGEGGDILITAGNSGGSTGQTGGDAEIKAGDAAGTDYNGGEVDISGGQGTGTQGSLIVMRVSEGGSSGTSLNPAVIYMRCRGGQTNIESYRHHKFDQNQSDKGSIELVPRVEPTSPPDGDMYLDSATDQLNIHNGTRYHALNSNVYALKDEGVQIVSAGSTFPYYEHYLEIDGSTKVAYQIPANTLRVGTVLKLDCSFKYTPSGNRTPRTYIGIDTTFMSSPSYVLPYAYFYVNSGSQSGYYYDTVYTRLVAVVKSIGSSNGVIWFNGTSNFVHNIGTVTPTSWSDIIRTLTSGGFVLNTTVPLYIFPFVRFGDIGSVGDWARCSQFSLEIE